MYCFFGPSTALKWKWHALYEKNMMSLVYFTLHLLWRITEIIEKYGLSNLMFYTLGHLTLFSMPLLQPLAFLPGSKHSQVPNKQQTLLLAHGLCQWAIPKLSSQGRGNTGAFICFGSTAFDSTSLLVSGSHLSHWCANHWISQSSHNAEAREVMTMLDIATSDFAVFRAKMLPYV